MLKHSLLAVALMAALAAPVAASAQSGFFVDGAIGQVSIDEDGLDDNDTSFRIGGGWSFNRYFGLEAGWTDLGKFEEEVAIGGATASAETDGFYAGVRGKFPFYEGENGFYVGGRAGFLRWDASGRARVGTVTVRLDESGTDPYFGVGAGYDFSRNFGVGLNYDRYDIDDSNLDVWNVSATWRF